MFDCKGNQTAVMDLPALLAVLRHGSERAKIAAAKAILEKALS